MSEEKRECNWDCIDATKVYSIYMAILELIKIIGIRLPMYARTIEEIHKLGHSFSNTIWELT